MALARMLPVGTKVSFYRTKIAYNYYSQLLGRIKRQKMLFISSKLDERFQFYVTFSERETARSMNKIKIYFDGLLKVHRNNRKNRFCILQLLFLGSL